MTVRGPKKLAICTWRPYNPSDTRYVIPQTLRGIIDRGRGLCGLLLSTIGPTCKRPAGHKGYCDGNP